MGRKEKSQQGGNNQSPNWIKQSKTLQASSEGAVCSHHPKLSMEQLAFHLQQVASSPHACVVLRTERHLKWQEPKKRKVSGFKFSFYWRKEKKKEKNRLFLFVCLFVCFQVDVIHVVSLSQCPKATSLYTKYLQVHCTLADLSFPLSLSAFQGGAAWNKSESESKEK